MASGRDRNLQVDSFIFCSEKLRERLTKMWSDLLLQAALILISIFTYLFMHNIPQNLYSKLQMRRQARTIQARRHFVLGAQRLAQARTAKDLSSSMRMTLAKSAEEEAEKAIGINAKDAALHLLKAMALEVQGFKTSALDAMNVALSPLAAKSLSVPERAEALHKRAELKLAVSKGEQIDSAVEDLIVSVRLKGDNVKGLCLLGELYEKKELSEEARKSYEDALKIQPDYSAAQDALARLSS
nr:Tetratricopeptide-like helical [Ipomoea batatas]GME01556.1 Tetratricopeptide-like helical [Ipomoea batatas]